MKPSTSTIVVVWWVRVVDKGLFRVRGVRFINSASNSCLKNISFGRCYVLVSALSLVRKEVAGLPFAAFTAGCFRDVFFFSLLGLIVSVLCFVLRGPLTSVLGPVASATWGTLGTVSVSTVMLCTKPSCFDLICFADKALDCRAITGGGTDVVLRRATL